LHISFNLENAGNVVLPASVGAHPAFNWPLAPGTAKDAHRIVFDDREPEPMFRNDAQDRRSNTGANGAEHL
jgi:galactose mutarotase-like enzyme